MLRIKMNKMKKKNGRQIERVRPVYSPNFSWKCPALQLKLEAPFENILAKKKVSNMFFFKSADYITEN